LQRLLGDSPILSSHTCFVEITEQISQSYIFDMNANLPLSVTVFWVQSSFYSVI